MKVGGDALDTSKQPLTRSNRSVGSEVLLFLECALDGVTALKKNDLEYAFTGALKKEAVKHVCLGLGFESLILHASVLVAKFGPLGVIGGVGGRFGTGIKIGEVWHGNNGFKGVAFVTEERTKVGTDLRVGLIDVELEVVEDFGVRLDVVLFLGHAKNKIVEFLDGATETGRAALLVVLVSIGAGSRVVVVIVGVPMRRRRRCCWRSTGAGRWGRAGRRRSAHGGWLR